MCAQSLVKSIVRPVIVSDSSLGIGRVGNMLSELGRGEEKAADRVDVVRNETVPSQLKQSVQDTSSSKRVDTDGFEKILKRRKEFKLHIGATFSIPGMENLSRISKTTDQKQEVKKETESDPFAGLPFRQLAEYLGERVVPAVEAAREDQLKAMREHKQMVKEMKVNVPYVPHVLPVTRWAAQNADVQATLVVDEKNLQKPRLSWYHPDDTMVPRDWFTKGLLEDLQYYAPFGFFQSKK